MGLLQNRLWREIREGTRHAVSTPGDLLFHIRSSRMDLCFELTTRIMTRIGDAVEVHGFRYFDNRDLIGFVDGTENPHWEAAVEDSLKPTSAHNALTSITENGQK